jgi:hypothetical protein
MVSTTHNAAVPLRLLLSGRDTALLSLVRHKWFLSPTLQSTPIPRNS